MLVHYTNGHRECIGQFRPDWAVETVSLRDKDTMFLRYVRIAPGPPVIVAITPKAPPKTDDIGWGQIPISGTLEWWFDKGCPILYQDGEQIEPPREVLWWQEAEKIYVK